MSAESNLIDALFGEDEGPAYYPGSKKTRTKAPSPVEFIPDPWRDNYTTKAINGVDHRLYAIGSFASALGVSVQTVRSWTRLGFIPQAPYRLPSNMVVQGSGGVAGRRLYTEAIIDATTTILEKHGLLGKPRIIWSDYSDVTIEIIDAWTRIVQSPVTN